MADSFIYGFHAVVSRIRRKTEEVTEIYLHPGAADPRFARAAATAERQGVRVIFMEASRLDGMVGNDKHQGVVAKVEGGTAVP